MISATVVHMADEVDHCPPHRWRIAEQRGQQSNGCCMKCGTEKLFNNWDRDVDRVSPHAGLTWAEQMPF